MTAAPASAREGRGPPPSQDHWRTVPISAPAERLRRDSKPTGRRATTDGSAWQETDPWPPARAVSPTTPGTPSRTIEAPRKAGLPDAGLRTLRHAAAGVGLGHDVPLEVVSEVLGHSSLALTGDVRRQVTPRSPAAPWTS
jgi:integrase